MILTANEIMLLFYRSLIASPVVKEATGGVYYAEDRPKNSTKEDILIAFTSGETDQIQEGIVTVMLYVPDITDSDGTSIPDRGRIMKLSRMLIDWGDSLRATGLQGFMVKIKGAPQLFADTTEFFRQHFVSLKLNYKVHQ